MKIFVVVLLTTCVLGDKLEGVSRSNTTSRQNDARALRQTQSKNGGYTYQQPNQPFGSGSASSISQAVNLPSDYLPPTNPRPTFAPATFPPTRPAVQPPRPPPVRPISPIATFPPTNPPATFPPTQPIVIPQRPVIPPVVPIPAPSAVVDITRPIIQPVIAEPGFGANMLLMPQQPNGPMPTISNLDVECAKESMVVRITFSLPFSGTIYAKGFSSRPECTFVRFNSRQSSYTFTLVLNECGTQFIDELSSGGQAYLENTIVVQNEPGIQEIWDTSRQIRCLWEGQLDKVVTSSFNVDQLDSQIVSFSGDTASAFMDIQVGKGPFAQSANGLVRIGETMTMVVSVTGDPGFDIHVRDCIAHDGNRNNPVTLTDSNGCVLKKKLMGPWQKSRQTGKADVNIVAFSFFQAFKFPDQVEVFLECNIELCKNECGFCPEDQALFDVRDGKRRKRSLHFNNATDVSDPVRLARRIRVLSPDDITSYNGHSTITLTSGEKIHSNDDICLSLTNFIVGMIITLFILIVSCVLTAILCMRVRNIPGTESTYPPSTNSYHAFSSISKSIS